MQDKSHKKRDRSWTKDELTLKSGPKDLARAVIKQWILDGKPKTDAEAISYWINILYMEDK